MKKFQTLKNTFSHTLETHPRGKDVPHKIHQISNAMTKIPLVKEKDNSIVSGFLLDSLQVIFHCGVSQPCPMKSTYCVIAGDTHSDIVGVYPEHFHQSHSCMHIKEGCITVCVKYGGS